MDNQLTYLEVLKNKGVDLLFHANTVATSLTFLNSNGLLSRQYVEENGLTQTKQYTDSTDKILGVYNDIFFDSCDIHARASRSNLYGPVLFVYDVRLLEIYESVLGITKSNPCRWNTAMSFEERYFQSPEEVSANFCYGTFEQHITLRNIGCLDFAYLKYIVFDTIDMENSDVRTREIWNSANSKLARLCAEKNIQFFLRSCKVDCSCKTSFNISHFMI